jgi:soluble lytic murein transglycosylase
MIEREAAEHDLDPHLLAALIRQESTFRTAVVSGAGAQGLMQLMPATARELARRVGIPWDERFLSVGPVNLHLGATHLASLMRTYRGDVIAALAAYNAGGRPVARWLRYPEANDPPMFVERIPYVETRGYVRSVLRNWALYQGLYPLVETAEADER